MRFKNKPFVVFLFVFIFAILIIVSLGNAGILRHTVMSPFETLVAEDEQTYTSTIATVASETVVANIYKHFDEYVYDDILEPFCRIGGQYRVLVHNDPTPGHDVQDWDMKMYYCKTTLDLLERVRIPAGWSQSDLLVYCNDGANIISNATNYDFITAQMNTYKACVIRNLDLDDHNTLVFGYDVGNKVVDNYEEYFFDNSTMKGPVLTNLVHLRDGSSSTGSSTSYIGRYRVPYKEKEVNSRFSFSDDSDSEWVPMDAQEAKRYIISESNLQADVDIYHQGNYPVYDDGDASSESYSIYSVRVPYTYVIGEYVFNYTKTNREYYFGYDFNDGFYYMKDFAEPIEIELLDVFKDANIGLSRVALFKKVDNKFIYGYEQVSNSVSGSVPYSDSLKPVYKIRLENFGFGQQRCVDSLRKYSSMHNIFEANTGVSCNGNEISIVALNVDANQNDAKYSFHLFKNIVTNLE